MPKLFQIDASYTARVLSEDSESAKKKVLWYLKQHPEELHLSTSYISSVDELDKTEAPK